MLASPVLIFSRSASQQGPFGITLYSVSINIYLQSMSVEVEGDHLRVAGSVLGAGDGFSVDGTFSVLLFIEVSNGVLNVRQDQFNFTANVSFAWWVYGLVALTGGSLALLLTATI